MIGVLGGMGPGSTAYTYMKMVEYCQKKYGARLDSDFPPILIYSMPVPDVVEDNGNDGEVLACLDSGLGKLEGAGAEFSIIPCNSMQGFVPELRKRFELLSIVEETLIKARKRGLRNWGILATEVTIGKGYFQKAFSAAGLSITEPAEGEQLKLTSAIRGILAGERETPLELLEDVALCLRENGAEGLILACTDLPLVVEGKLAGLETVDTAQVIAEAAIDRFKSTSYQRGGI